MMDEFFEVGTLEDFPIGTSHVRVVNDRKIALFHTRSGLFASDNTCPHRGGPLGEGDLIGEEVICPWHLWTFDVRTGKTDIDSDLHLTTHEVRVDERRVLVRLSADGPEAAGQ